MHSLFIGLKYQQVTFSKILLQVMLLSGYQKSRNKGFLELDVAPHRFSLLLGGFKLDPLAKTQYKQKLSQEARNWALYQLYLYQTNFNLESQKNVCCKQKQDLTCGLLYKCRTETRGTWIAECPMRHKTNTFQHSCTTGPESSISPQ